MKFDKLCEARILASVEFIIKLRDATLMIADAANEYLEKLAPQDEKKRSWDPSKCRWVWAEGQKGKYQKSDDVDNPQFKALIKDLEDHQDKLSRDGWFYWKFSRSAIVGRKQKRA